MSGMNVGGPKGQKGPQVDPDKSKPEEQKTPEQTKTKGFATKVFEKFTGLFSSSKNKQVDLKKQPGKTDPLFQQELRGGVKESHERRYSGETGGAQPSEPESPSEPEVKPGAAKSKPTAKGKTKGFASQLFGKITGLFSSSKQEPVDLKKQPGKTDPLFQQELRGGVKESHERRNRGATGSAQPSQTESTSEPKVAPESKGKAEKLKNNLKGVKAKGNKFLDMVKREISKAGKDVVEYFRQYLGIDHLSEERFANVKSDPSKLANALGRRKLSDDQFQELLQEVENIYRNEKKNDEEKFAELGKMRKTLDKNMTPQQKRNFDEMAQLFIPRSVIIQGLKDNFEGVKLEALLLVNTLGDEELKDEQVNTIMQNAQKEILESDQLKEQDKLYEFIEIADILKGYTTQEQENDLTKQVKTQVTARLGGLIEQAKDRTKYERAVRDLAKATPYMEDIDREEVVNAFPPGSFGV